MNLLIHDLAAAIEREACSDLDHRDRYEHRGVATYETRHRHPNRGAGVVEQPAADGQPADHDLTL